MKVEQLVKTHSAPAEPKQLAVKDIPAVPEVALALKFAAHGNYSNQYRGWMDAAGTVRVRAYVTGDPAALKGEILAVTDKDVTLAEPTDDTGKIIKIEYRNTAREGVLLVEWVPAGTEIKGLKVILG